MKGNFLLFREVGHEDIDEFFDFSAGFCDSLDWKEDGFDGFMFLAFF